MHSLTQVVRTPLSSLIANASAAAIGVMECMMQFDPAKRPSAAHCACHCAPKSAACCTWHGATGTACCNAARVATAVSCAATQRSRRAAAGLAHEFFKGPTDKIQLQLLRMPSQVARARAYVCVPVCARACVCARV